MHSTDQLTNALKQSGLYSYLAQGQQQQFQPAPQLHQDEQHKIHVNLTSLKPIPPHELYHSEAAATSAGLQHEHDSLLRTAANRVCTDDILCLVMDL
jgi:hypothetical protein